MWWGPRCTVPSSCCQLIPITSSPCAQDAKGMNYVQTVDFVRVGLASSVFAYSLVVTVGYGLMLLIGW